MVSYQEGDDNKNGEVLQVRETWQKVEDRKAGGIREGFKEGTFVHWDIYCLFIGIRVFIYL